MSSGLFWGTYMHAAITRRFTNGLEIDSITIIGDTALIDPVWCYHAATACMLLKNCMVSFPLLDEATRRLPHEDKVDSFSLR